MVSGRSLAEFEMAAIEDQAGLLALQDSPPEDVDPTMRTITTPRVALVPQQVSRTLAIDGPPTAKRARVEQALVPTAASSSSSRVIFSSNQAALKGFLQVRLIRRIG